MRAFILVIFSVLVFAGCGEDEPKTVSDAAMKTAKDAADTVKQGVKTAVSEAKNAVTALPAGVQQAMPTFENFSQMCAQCHDTDDVKRYETTFLPMYKMMFDPQAWVNPNAYGRVMQPMMDPETYTKWYEAWTKNVMSMPVPGAQEKK